MTNIIMKNYSPSMSPLSLSRYSFSSFYDHMCYTVQNYILQEYGECNHDSSFEEVQDSGHTAVDGGIDHRGTTQNQQCRVGRSPKRSLQHQQKTTQKSNLVPILSNSPIYSSQGLSTTKSMSSSSSLPGLVGLDDSFSSSSSSSSSTVHSLSISTTLLLRTRRGGINNNKSVRFESGTEFPQTIKDKKVKRTARDQSTTSVIAVSKLELYRPKPIIVAAVSPSDSMNETVKIMYNSNNSNNMSPTEDASTFIRHSTATTERSRWNHFAVDCTETTTKPGISSTTLQPTNMNNINNNRSNNPILLLAHTRPKETFMTKNSEGRYVMASRC
jgi:hypothetical protein